MHIDIYTLSAGFRCEKASNKKANLPEFVIVFVVTGHVYCDVLIFVGLSFVDVVPNSALMVHSLQLVSSLSHKTRLTRCGGILQSRHSW